MLDLILFPPRQLEGPFRTQLNEFFAFDSWRTDSQPSETGTRAAPTLYRSRTKNHSRQGRIVMINKAK